MLERPKMSRKPKRKSQSNFLKDKKQSSRRASLSCDQALCVRIYQSRTPGFSKPTCSLAPLICWSLGLNIWKYCWKEDIRRVSAISTVLLLGARLLGHLESCSTTELGTMTVPQAIDLTHYWHKTIKSCTLINCWLLHASYVPGESWQISLIAAEKIFDSYCMCIMHLYLGCLVFYGQNVQLSRYHL